MSERGSFATEYIYCGNCLEAAKKVLCQDDKFLRGVQISSWEKKWGIRKKLPIIAGKIGSLYAGGEIIEFEAFEQQLAKVICHPLRVVVIAENGTNQVFSVQPGKGGLNKTFSDFKVRQQ